MLPISCCSAMPTQAHITGNLHAGFQFRTKHAVRLSGSMVSIWAVTDNRYLKGVRSKTFLHILDQNYATKADYHRGSNLISSSLPLLGKNKLPHSHLRTRWDWRSTASITWGAIMPTAPMKFEHSHVALHEEDPTVIRTDSCSTGIIAGFDIPERWLCFILVFVSTFVFSLRCLGAHSVGILRADSTLVKWTRMIEPQEVIGQLHINSSWSPRSSPRPILPTSVSSASTLASPHQSNAKTQSVL